MAPFVTSFLVPFTSFWDPVKVDVESKHFIFTLPPKFDKVKMS